MKKSIITAFLLTSTMAFAQPAQPQAPNQENFTQIKAEFLQMIDKRIQQMQASKQCVEQATNKQALHQCREQSRNARAENMELRKDLKRHNQEMGQRGPRGNGPRGDGPPQGGQFRGAPPQGGGMPPQGGGMPPQGGQAPR